MRVSRHLLNDLKPLTGNETIGEILDIMEELKYAHLPVVDNEKLYLGVLCEDDLLEVSEENQRLSDHMRLLKAYSINEGSDIFDAIKTIGEGNLTLLPVIGEKGVYVGYISAVELLQDLGRSLTFSEPGSVVVLRLSSRDYQLAQVAQIVESDDARIIGVHLNQDKENNELLLCLKINQMDLSRIVKSFERYNYNIVEVFHQSLFEDSLEDRYESFIKYLNT